MLIGEVVGSVVSTRKDEQLVSHKLLVVQVRSHANKPKDQYVVAVDSVGAGPGGHRPLCNRLLRAPDDDHQGPPL